MVYGLVHAVGGHILVESDPGKASIFHIYLPLEAASGAYENTMPHKTHEMLEKIHKLLLDRAMHSATKSPGAGFRNYSFPVPMQFFRPAE